MNITINVVGQKMTTNYKKIVEGSQNFVKFTFNLPDEWKEINPSACFCQGDKVVKVLLDTNNSVFLPSQITSGKCELMLYGAKENGESGDIIGTSNSIVLQIDSTHSVEWAEDIEYVESQYAGWVDRILSDAKVEIMNVQETINTLQMSVDDIDKSVEQSKTDVAIAVTKAESAVESANTVEQKITDIEESIVEIEEKVGTSDTDGAIQAAIDAIEDRINDIESKVGSETDNGTINSSISEIENQITEIEGKVGAEGITGTIETKVSEIEDTIAEIESNVDTLLSQSNAENAVNVSNDSAHITNNGVEIYNSDLTVYKGSNNQSEEIIKFKDSDKCLPYALPPFTLERYAKISSNYSSFAKFSLVESDLKSDTLMVKVTTTSSNISGKTAYIDHSVQIEVKPNTKYHVSCYIKKENSSDTRNINFQCWTLKEDAASGNQTNFRTNTQSNILENLDDGWVKIGGVITTQNTPRAFCSFVIQIPGTDDASFQTSPIYYTGISLLEDGYTPIPSMYIQGNSNHHTEVGNGSVFATDSITGKIIEITSDAAEKTNITEIGSILDSICSSSIYSYNYVSESSSSDYAGDIGLNGDLELGDGDLEFEETPEYTPEETIELPTYYGLVIGDGYNTPSEIISADGKHINLYSMTSFAWKAIQELASALSKTQAELSALKESIETSASQTET